MAREDERRRGPEGGYRREPGGRYSSDSARRSERGDDRNDTGADHRDDTGYGNEWPEDYHSDFSGQAPQRYRDSYSERQSGPYRSPTTGRSISEDEYRQEAQWHRSRPHTGFKGRVAEFGTEDPKRVRSEGGSNT